MPRRSFAPSSAAGSAEETIHAAMATCSQIVVCLQKPAAAGLVVVGESDYKILLVHKLCTPEKYTRQGGMRPCKP